MNVVLPFSPGDADQALLLLEFIGQLGGCQEFGALLVVDAAVDWGKCVDAITLANRIFRSASLVCTEAPVEGWPAGANALWRLAANHAKANNVPFLWLEPDTVPLKRGWLVSIHKMRGSGYFGHIYDWPEQGKQLLSGVAVYPPDAIDVIGPCIDAHPTQAWDVSSADFVLRHATPTKLIQHIWGEKELPPTFVEAKTPNSPRNAFALSDLFPEAVLFHRNKDGTLLNILRRNLGLAAAGNFVVVLPFCNLDVDLLVKNLDWMNAMGMPKTHDCMLSADRTTLRESIARVAARAREVFCSVQTTTYGVPHGTRFASTAAWQHAARTMHRLYRNWMWLEADAIPIKPNWLSVLQTVYDNCGKPFCGPAVEGAHHMNGTPAIYPANTPEICPRTMSHTNNAFDCEMAQEMMHLCKDIGHIAFCAWGVVNGRLNSLTGEPPSFPPGSQLLNQIPKTAVVFHRDKAGSLIDRLMT
jgi:hypothetical protein